MKKTSTLLLITVSIILLIFNIALLFKVNNCVTKIKLENQIVLNDMVGTWEDGDAEIYIYDDGTVVLVRYSTSKRTDIISSSKGYIDGDNVIFTHKSSGSCIAVSQIEYEKDVNGNFFYKIVMYGQNAFTLGDFYNFVRK